MKNLLFLSALFLQAYCFGQTKVYIPPVDYVPFPYFEFYTDQNGRMVIELKPDQVEILAPPIPACESDPISREKQEEN